MKRALFTLISLAALQSAGAYAQVEGTTETDVSTENPDSVEVVISPKEGQDSTIVRIGDMKIIVLDNNRKNGSTDEVIIDTVEDDTNYSSNYKKHSTVHHWVGFRMGVDGYLSDGGLSMPTSDEYLELDYARSIGWSLNFLEKDFHLVGNYIELVTGLGLNMTNYTFESEFATIQNTNPLTAEVDSSRVLDRNRLKVYHLTAPLMLGFATNEDQSKAIRFAFGGQVSWRIGSRLKQKYSQNGETVKPKVKSDYNLNPFLFHAIASVGYGPLNVYANYGLNTVFEDDKAPELYPFNAGIQLMF